MTAHGVNFIDEDDTWGAFFALDEQDAHTGGPHAYEHLDEIGPADTEEGHPGFAGNGPGQEGFPRARGAHQEDTFGDTAAQPGELLWIFKEIDDFRHFFFGFF